MAYTAVKLADVQKAIAAVTAANKKYTDAQASSKTSQTAVTNAQKALDAAQAKLDKLQAAFNDGSFLSNNTAYQNALKAIAPAEAAREKAYKSMFDNDYKKAKAGEVAYGKAIAAVDKAYAALDTARANAEKAYQNGTIKPAQTAFDTANKTFETAQTKYQNLVNSFQPLLDQRNEAIGNVSSYIDTIRGSLSDVTKFADAKQVQTLLGQIQTAVKGTKLDDLIKPVSSMISQIDPLKMAAIPKINIQGANPDAFSNIDPNTGLPILDQGGLDSVLDRYKSNKIDTQQYRDNWNKFGWNVKSDASTAMRGPAIVGLDMGYIQQGMGGGSPGIVRAGTREAASDADFKKAADQLGININDYYTTKEFSGAYGTKSTQKVLDRQSLYNDIADRTKDFYMVANSIDGDKHAALLFRADGSGNLVPVTNAQGAPMANYYTATRNVTGETWYGGLLPIAAVAASFALPGLGTAFAQSAAGSALAGAIGTTAATAVTNAALSAGLAAITGGDVGKAALTAGLGTVAAQNATQIANKIVGEQNIKAIADAANLTRGQVENIVAAGLNEGLASAITGQGDILQNMAKSVASGFTSESARNIATRAVLNADQDTISRVADSVANLTNVGTQAALNGLNPVEAIAAAAPSIITSTSGVSVEERAPIEDRSVIYGQQEAYQQVLEAFGVSPEEARAEAFRMAQQGFSPQQVGEKLAQARTLATHPGYETVRLPAGSAEAGILEPVPVTEKYELEDLIREPWDKLAPSDPWYKYYSGFQNQAQNLYQTLGISPSSADVNALAGELMSDALAKTSQTFGVGEAPVSGTGVGVGVGTGAGAGTGTGTGVGGLGSGDAGTGAGAGAGAGTGAGGAGAGGTGTGGTGTGGEGTGEDAAQREAALQQYQQYLQKIKTQQQQKTQELIDPKSIYYLTPEEQAARGYINPAELYESITPFKRGGLASMKRNAKWQ